MNQSFLHHGFDGYRDAKCPKPASLDPAGRFNHLHFVDDIRHGQEDVTSRSNTPSMTRGSSRSTSSSVVFCEVCGHWGAQCICQSQSDTESVRVHSSDVDFTNSPTISSVELVPQKKDKSKLAKIYLRDLDENSFSPGGLKGIHPAFPQSLTNGYQDRVVTSSENGSSMGRTSLLANVTTEPDFVVSQQHQTGYHGAPERENSDSEMSDSQDEDDEDDSADEDNDWSGQDDSLEAIVLDILGSDLELAAFLIPLLHKSCYFRLNASTKKKIFPWRNGLTKSTPSGEDTSTGQTSSSNAQSNEATSGSRKRQRQYGSANQNREVDNEEEEDEDEEEDGNNNSKGLGDPDSNGSPRQLPRLACPFYKFDPTKYCIQHSSTENSKRPIYRACEGPGFKNIQRLKEHLKRTHYPVQCDRCWHIFTGPDRAGSVMALESHRQLPDSCELRVPTMKEGISDAQWAKLDKKKSVKKDQAIHRVEKYWEIWDILFPDMRRPSNPWYDEKIAGRHPVAVTGDAAKFTEFFDGMLDLKVQQHHIRFPLGLEVEMSEKVKKLAQQAFSLFTGIHGTGSSSNSSSSRSLQQPSLVSSYEMVESRSKQGRHYSSASLSSVARSQAYSAQNSPTPQSVVMNSRNHRHSMAPPPQYMNMQQQQQSQMSSHTFMQNPMDIGMQSQHSTHQPFPVDMANNIATFGTDQFQDSTLNSNAEAWYEVDFDTGATNFNGNSTAASFVDLSSEQINQTMMAQDTQSMPRWQQMPAPRRPHFDGQSR